MLSRRRLLRLRLGAAARGGAGESDGARQAPSGRTILQRLVDLGLGKFDVDDDGVTVPSAVIKIPRASMGPEQMRWVFRHRVNFAMFATPEDVWRRLIEMAETQTSPPFDPAPMFSVAKPAATRIGWWGA